MDLDKKNAQNSIKESCALNFQKSIITISLFHIKCYPQLINFLVAHWLKGTNR